MNVVRPGDTLETAIWMDGTETPAVRARYEDDVARCFQDAAERLGVRLGPATMTEKAPGGDRVPPVPEHVHGPHVRLLVAEAPILGPRLNGRSLGSRQSLFVADLDPRDLGRLRAILRRVHQAWNPGKPELTDEQCDSYINENGPDAALAALREQVGIKVA